MAEETYQYGNWGPAFYGVVPATPSAYLGADRLWHVPKSADVTVERLHQNTTTVGLAANTSEQALHTFILRAGKLVNAGDTVRIRTWVRCAATANNKAIKVYFGGTVIGSSTGQTFNNVGFDIEAYIFRVTQTTQKALCVAVQPNIDAAWSIATGGGLNTSAPAEDLSGAVTISIAGISSVAGAANDIQVLATVIDYITAV